tara:strand:+ start:3373 stop:3759 length:387 start_codon:yes stop_codon:yes gene_type:complete
VETPNERTETIVEDASLLLASNDVVEHTISVNPDDKTQVMKVRVRNLSFLDMQNAIKSFVNISTDGGVEIDIAGYWRYMMEKCIVSTDPTLGRGQLLSLNQYVGGQLTALLPQPQDLMTGPLVDGSIE